MASESIAHEAKGELACVVGAKRGGRGGGGKARKRGKGRERLL